MCGWIKVKEIFLQKLLPCKSVKHPANSDTMCNTLLRRSSKDERAVYLHEYIFGIYCDWFEREIFNGL